MKCYGYPGSGGICVMRQGNVLSEDDCAHIHELPDKEVCKWKEGLNCVCSGSPDKNNNEVVKIEVKNENEPLKDKDIFDAFFED